jgi:steroid delta-isomerase-like uncharacterized protein
MKKLSLCLVTSIVLIACNSSSPKTTTNTENEKIVQQYFEYFNNHDWAKMANLYTENAQFKDPSLGAGVVQQTRQQVIDKYAALAKMFPDVKDRLVQTYASGDKNVIVEFVSTGTAPDSAKFELPICTIFTIENGKITKDFTYYDNFEEPAQEEKK